jgi:hypothetical protein
MLGLASRRAAPPFRRRGARLPISPIRTGTTRRKRSSNTNGQYCPYDIFLGPPGYGSYGSFVAPHVATLVLNYKHDKWAVTPALQFSAGQKYGYPESTMGVNPSLGCASLGIAPSTSRNPFTYTPGALRRGGDTVSAFQRLHRLPAAYLIERDGIRCEKWPPLRRRPFPCRAAKGHECSTAINARIAKSRSFPRRRAASSSG